MSLKEETLVRIKMLEGETIDDNSKTFLGYKIETKKTLSFVLENLLLSFFICYLLFFVCFLLQFKSESVANTLAIIGFTLIAIIDIALLLLFIISLIKQPTCFFIDIRDKKISVEKVLCNLKYDINETEFVCYGVFIKLINNIKRFDIYYTRIDKMYLFVPIEKVDRENLIFLIKENRGKFICKNKHCNRCCDINPKLNLRKTIDEQWEEITKN